MERVFELKNEDAKLELKIKKLKKKLKKVRASIQNECDARG